MPVHNNITPTISPMQNNNSVLETARERRNEWDAMQCD